MESCVSNVHGSCIGCKKHNHSLAVFNGGGWKQNVLKNLELERSEGGLALLALHSAILLDLPERHATCARCK